MKSKDPLPWPLLSPSLEVCRGNQSGHRGRSAPSAPGLGPIHMSEVRCIGHERSLGECRFQDGEQSGCRHDDDAAVRCHVPHMDFQSQVSPCPIVQPSTQSPIAQPLHAEPHCTASPCRAFSSLPIMDAWSSPRGWGQVEQLKPH